tara:strand:- start:64 stop:399 length:336 start_codon:yes stop_codon:yes gene_type:complete
MTKAKGDFLWAPKEAGVVTGLLDNLGFEYVGKSKRYPAGLKTDTLIAIRDAIISNDVFASMVSTRTRELQSARKSVTTRIKASSDAVLKAVMSGDIPEAELKKALKEAGII